MDTLSPFVAPGDLRAPTTCRRAGPLAPGCTVWRRRPSSAPGEDSRPGYEEGTADPDHLVRMTWAPGPRAYSPFVDDPSRVVSDGSGGHHGQCRDSRPDPVRRR